MAALAEAIGRITARAEAMMVQDKGKKKRGEGRFFDMLILLGEESLMTAEAQSMVVEQLAA